MNDNAHTALPHNSSSTGDTPPIERLRTFLTTEFVQRFAVAITLYAFALSVCYLWPYWAVFRINPFQYVGVADIPILALAFVGPLIILIIFYVATFVMYSPQELKSLYEMTPLQLRLQKYVTVKISVVLTVIYLVAIVSILVATIAQYRSTGEFDPSLFIALPGFVMPLLLGRNLFLVAKNKRLSKERAALTSIVGALIFPPLITVSWALYSATSLKFGHRYDKVYVYLKSMDRGLVNLNIQHIGHLGSYDFFQEIGTHKILMVPSEDIASTLSLSGDDVSAEFEETSKHLLPSESKPKQSPSAPQE
jgi:hypothetical protein